jgi:Zinc carboxypeptidase
MSEKRVFVALLLSGALILALAPAGTTSQARPTLVRVHVDSADEAAYLLNYFDETHNHASDEVELLLWPGDRSQLDELGFDYEVVVDDLFAHDMREGTAADSLVRIPGPNRKDYRVLGDYNREMKALAKKNPRLVKLFKMKRKTLEGRTVYGVEIAANVKKANDGRPIFYIDGVHHAREWPASEYTMIYVHHLVEKFGKDRKVTKLLRKARVIAVPIVNADGFNYSRESVLSINQDMRDRTSLTGTGNGFEGYWRKNRRSFTGATAPTGTNPDAYGVDPNRNYSYLWGDSNGGSSGMLFDQTYRGDHPFSEPETRNVRDIILGRPVTGVLTNHTYQGSVLRTGGGKAPEDKLLSRFGQKMADILRYRNAPTVGYPTTGTTDDWAYAAMSALGYTIEHGIQGFHPAYDKEVGAFWKPHMKAFDVMFGLAANSKYHSVIKGRVPGGPARLRITKTFKTPLSPGNPAGKKAVTEKIKMNIKTRRNGSFAWHVSPSSRPYEKKPESFKLNIKSGRGSKTLRVRVDRGEVENLGRIRL